jgi:hypothetical protein
MKKKLSMLLGSILVFSAVLAIPAFAQSSDADVSLNGSSLRSRAVIDGDTVFLPLRSICENLGYKVSWAVVDKIKTVDVQKEGRTVSLSIGDGGTMNVDGHSFYAWMNDGNAISVLNDRTYIESNYFDQTFSTKTKYEAGSGTITVQSVAANGINIETVPLTSQEKYLNLTIQYPQVSGLADSAAQNSINTVLKNAALKAQSEGEQNAKEMAESAATYSQDVDMKCSTNFNYTLRYNRNGLLSLSLTDYQFTGGNHGLIDETSYTFDLSTGKALSLSDLMQSGSGYITYFNSGIRKEIDKRVASGDLVEFDSEKFSSIADDPAYYLTSRGIVFYFQQYEYFPYSEGIQEFSFNYGNLKSMLKQVYTNL